MNASEFVRRQRASVEEPDRHYVFWLGAGCSVTSGIPAASALVRESWLPRLHRFKGASGSVEKWAVETFRDYRPESPGAFYGPLMKVLFTNAEERQRETERLCDGRLPGFGYGVLAALMSRGDGFFSTALTTNFDDLVADAMYVFGERRPLVIQHETLAGFVRPGRVQRPLVVKIHGDHRLNPMHTAEETAHLKESVAEGIRGLLQDRGLIFVGYSGNDRGVLETLESLPTRALPWGVWWVSRSEPQGLLRPWLQSREAHWVKASGFDELMLLFRDEFQIDHPKPQKFDRMFTTYRETYERLSSDVERLSDTRADAGPLKEAAQRASTEAPTWWRAALEANRVAEIDPNAADQIYRAAIKESEDPRLLGSYAVFLTKNRGAEDRAEELFKRAITADPTNPINLGNYARFLHQKGGEDDRAQGLYEQAITADPTNATALANYAGFLAERRKEDDRAQGLYEQAITADPNHAIGLGGYALLLAIKGGEDGRAEKLYEQAITADPTNAINLGNYALFIEQKGGEDDRIEKLYEQAITADPTNAKILGNYALFLKQKGEQDDRIEKLYEQAITADPTNAKILGSYALFLHEKGEDYNRIEKLYEQAITADPTNAINLGNYALFLLERKQDGKAVELIERSFEAAQSPEEDLLRVELWFYLLAAGSVNRRAEALRELATLLRDGVRSPGWDFSGLLTRARAEQHRDIEWLEKLAAVISDGADLEGVDGWEDWPGEVALTASRKDDRALVVGDSD